MSTVTSNYSDEEVVRLARSQTIVSEDVVQALIERLGRRVDVENDAEDARKSLQRKLKSLHMRLSALSYDTDSLSDDLSQCLEDEV